MPKRPALAGERVRLERTSGGFNLVVDQGTPVSLTPGTQVAVGGNLPEGSDDAFALHPGSTIMVVEDGEYLRHLNGGARVRLVDFPPETRFTVLPPPEESAANAA